MSIKIILLAGIPGMGKTKVGNHLKDNYGFYHVDLEDSQVNSSPEFVQFNQVGLEPDKLMAEINRRQKNTVITWGFGPEPESHGDLVLELQNLGAQMFWLDGDRVLAKKWWSKRDNPIPESLFDIQISRIDKNDIQGIFSPINLDTFDKSTNKHRDVENIIEEIFRKVGI